MMTTRLLAVLLVTAVVVGAFLLVRNAYAQDGPPAATDELPAGYVLLPNGTPFDPVLRDLRQEISKPGEAK